MCEACGIYPPHDCPCREGPCKYGAPSWNCKHCGHTVYDQHTEKEPPMEG